MGGGCPAFTRTVTGPCNRAIAWRDLVPSPRRGEGQGEGRRAFPLWGHVPLTRLLRRRPLPAGER
ncbi:hypothetical protein CHELA40_10894 [Chelatococcus asaccharovorans]|nr:hypothetical protein CHELA40_10894 [Chelatococcus asaccharovorans]CAH1685837.1 hypothetical protein CHELA17_64706 [Chelatococcus asaccharovorans]